MRAMLICFSIKSRKLKRGERVKFFKMLYGWKQVIHGKGKKYIYERRGILNRIPHLRIDQSSFIVPKRYFEEITNFLREWEDKVCLLYTSPSPRDRG